MNVVEFMNKSVTSVRPTDNLHTAAGIMWERDCGVLPVVDENEQVIGMISDRDICMAAYTQGRLMSDITVDTAMSKGLFECRSDQSIEDALNIMAMQQVRRLPVVDQKNQLVGILSLNDIALAYKSSKGVHIRAEDVITTLAAICEHSHPSHALIAA
jgi:CBS domain-containing protein